MQIVTVSLHDLQLMLDRTAEKAADRVVQLLSPQHAPVKTGTATRQQAADFLNITLPTLHQYTLSGKVKGQRVGNRVLYKWADLDAALTAIKTKIGGIPQ